MRASSATPCAFAQTSAIPRPAPSTQASDDEPQSDGANAATVRPVARRAQGRAQWARGCRRAAEPAGDRQEQRRRQRDGEDHEPELAAVEAEPVLQRREARGPDAVERAERDERDGERDVRRSQAPRHSVEPSDGVRSTTPAIAWPKPMHIAAMP